MHTRTDGRTQRTMRTHQTVPSTAVASSRQGHRAGKITRTPAPQIARRGPLHCARQEPRIGRVHGPERTGVDRSAQVRTKRQNDRHTGILARSATVSAVSPFFLRSMSRRIALRDCRVQQEGEAGRRDGVADWNKGKGDRRPQAHQYAKRLHGRDHGILVVQLHAVFIAMCRGNRATGQTTASGASS